MDFIVKKLQEPSSINALMAFAGVVGLNIAPELQGSIVSVVGGAFAIYNFVRRER